MTKPTITDEDRALIEAVISAYHTTRLDSDFAAHIMSKPMVASAFAAYRQAAFNAGLERAAVIAESGMHNEYGRPQPALVAAIRAEKEKV